MANESLCLSLAFTLLFADPQIRDNSGMDATEYYW